MILRRIAEGIKNQDWFVVLIEIFIVVIGIYIGLQVDDWSKERQDRQEEDLYLQELLDDFQNDAGNLTDAIENSKEVLEDMVGLLEQSAQESPNWSVARLNDAFRDIQRMPNFNPTQRAYANLTGSGDLKLIQNRELKNELAQYFRAAEVVSMVQNTHEMELVETFQPYIIENLDYQAVHLKRTEDFPLPPSTDEDQILDVLITREFRNIATQKWVIMNDLLNQFQQMQEKNDIIIKILENELGIEAE